MAKPWVPHVVHQGEHVRKLAYRYGVSAEAVWKHEKNQELARVRKNMDLLCPGDVLHLPSEPLPALSLDVGTANKFKAKVPTIQVKLRLDSPTRSLAGEPFEVHGVSSGGAPLSGAVGEGGEVEFEVPVLVREVEVRLPEAGIFMPVMIGDLDPIHELSGVTQRLRNLGFLPPSGDVDEGRLSGALRAFQRAQNMDETGALDDATRRAIEAEHLL